MLYDLPSYISYYTSLRSRAIRRLVQLCSHLANQKCQVCPSPHKVACPMQPEGDVSYPCVRVVRLSGEFLEVPLTRHEANKIVSVRDLKRCLAKNDTTICRSCPDSGQHVFLCFNMFYDFRLSTFELLATPTCNLLYLLYI